MKLIVVDDEIDLAETLARFLSRSGYDCMTAFNVQKAIDLIIPELPRPCNNGLSSAGWRRF